MNKPLLNKVVIFGVGLIGGSIVKVLEEKKIAKLVIGIDCDCNQDIPEALSKAELVILAVSPLQIERVMQQISPYIVADTVITDVCSAKQEVIHWAKKYFATHFSNFVPAHPIAGSEKTGSLYAKADLFQNKQVIITPGAETQESAIRLVTEFWQQCGAAVFRLTPQQHDKLFAWLSHLPHILIYALLDCFAQKTEIDHYLEYMGSGFQDFTRIGKSNPVLWQEICSINRAEVINALETYQTQLQQIIEMLHKHDDVSLLELFKRGREQLG
jgi:prephenate dehydrogenase